MSIADVGGAGGVGSAGGVGGVCWVGGVLGVGVVGVGVDVAPLQPMATTRAVITRQIDRCKNFVCNFIPHLRRLCCVRDNSSLCSFLLYHNDHLMLGSHRGALAPLKINFPFPLLRGRG